MWDLIAFLTKREIFLTWNSLVRICGDDFAIVPVQSPNHMGGLTVFSALKLQFPSALMNAWKPAARSMFRSKANGVRGSRV